MDLKLTFISGPHILGLDFHRHFLEIKPKTRLKVLKITCVIYALF